MDPVSQEAPKRWRAQFPYHWDADDLVSRRQLLKYSLYTSGALCAGTTAVAVLGAVLPQGSAREAPILAASELAEGEVHYFRYPGPEDEAMLIHLPGGQFVAYSQRCTHLSCSVLYQADRGRVYCPCHEGVFSPETGDPLAGPPRRRLPRIALRREGDVLWAAGLLP